MSGSREWLKGSEFIMPYSQMVSFSAATLSTFILQNPEQWVHHNHAWWGFAVTWLILQQLLYIDAQKARQSQLRLLSCMSSRSGQSHHSTSPTTHILHGACNSSHQSHHSAHGSTEWNSWIQTNHFYTGSTACTHFRFIPSRRFLVRHQCSQSLIDKKWITRSQTILAQLPVLGKLLCKSN